MWSLNCHGRHIWFADANIQAALFRNRARPKPDIAVCDGKPVQVIGKLQQDWIIDQYAGMIAERCIFALADVAFGKVARGQDLRQPAGIRPLQLYLPFDGHISLRHTVYEAPVFRFGLAKTSWYQHMVVCGEGRDAFCQRCLKVRRWPQTGGRGYAKHSAVRFIIVARADNLWLHAQEEEDKSGRKSGADQTAGEKSVTCAASWRLSYTCEL